MVFGVLILQCDLRAVNFELLDNLRCYFLSIYFLAYIYIYIYIYISALNCAAAVLNVDASRFRNLKGDLLSPHPGEFLPILLRLQIMYLIGGGIKCHK